MGKSKNLADLLSASGLIGAEDIESDAIPASGATTYATINDLPLSNLTSGALAYISSTDTFYIANGNGWYKVTTVNTVPNISNVTSSFTRSNLNQANVIIEAVASDAEGIPVSVSYQLEPASVSFVNGISTVGEVLTVDITSSSTSNSANVVVSTSDGVNVSTVKSLINFFNFNGEVDYLLIGGGGGGGGIIDGGGGAGGYRASWGTDPIANGGTVTEYVENGTKYYVHTFTSSGTFTTSSANYTNVDILLVGGGGGGGGGFYGDGGGGGGAGGVVYSTNQTLASSTAFTIGIGSGGSGGFYGAGSNGNNTTMTGQTTAVGGGGGADGVQSGASGGSGGGGGSYGSAGGAGTAGQGNDGGDSEGGYSGGGGGAGAVGGNGDQNGASGGNGGDGVQIDITGTNVYYGGGGGGQSDQTPGQGGLGGGGDGATWFSNGVSGDPNTGGGGGGTVEAQGGGGGSGVVIIRYALQEDDLGTAGNSGGLSALESQLTLTPGTAYTVRVGQGGEGGLGWDNGDNHRGHKGRDTSISGSDITTITAEGGGGGSGLNVTSTEMDGGSGGGGSNVQDGGSGTANQGHDGGNDSNSGNNSGGGGGAGAVGQNAPTTTSSGAGGDGLPSTISGSLVTRAGGGGGGIRQTTGTASGAGGAGGGGNGGYQSLAAVDYNGGAGGQTAATHAKRHTGSGGGGGGYSGNSNLKQGGNGASGTAIFRITKNANYDANTFASDLSSTYNMKTQYVNSAVYGGDPYFNDVVMLLSGRQGSGTDIIDDSLSNIGFSRWGSVQNDPSVYKFGGGSVKFDGSGDTLRNNTNNDPIQLVNDDFTIETWVRLNSMPISDSWPGSWMGWMVIVTTGTPNLTDGWQFRIGQTQLAFGGDSDATLVTGTHGMTTDTWYHLAVARSGTSYSLHVDGTVIGTATTANLPGTSQYTWIGSETNQGAYLNGYIDDLRITKGVRRYTSSFTPPSAELPSGVNSTGGDHILIFQQNSDIKFTGGTDNSSYSTWTPSFS